MHCNPLIQKLSSRQTFLALFLVLERGALPILDETATGTSHCAVCAVAVELSVNKPISLSKLPDILSVLDLSHNFGLIIDGNNNDNNKRKTFIVDLYSVAVLRRG